MSKLKKIAVIVIHSFRPRPEALAFLLVAGGCVLMARPTWHYGLRQYMTLKSHSIWWHAGSTVQSGAPALWLTIPERGIDTLVLHGATPENLQRFPCLESGDGVPLILAHRDTHFRALRAVKVNDRIKIVYPDGKCVKFRVSELEILTPEQAWQRVQNNQIRNKLLLMTCYPFKYIGPAPNRLLVWANSETEHTL